MVKTSPRVTSTYQCHHHLLSVLRSILPTKFLSSHCILSLKLSNLIIFWYQVGTRCPRLIWHMPLTSIPLHRSITVGHPTYLVFSITRSCFIQLFPVMVQLCMPIILYATAKFHRRAYAVSVATVISCEIVTNWSYAVYPAHITSILIELYKNIIHNIPVGIVL